MHRSRLSFKIIALILLLGVSPVKCLATNLYIFYPTDIRPKSLQNQINQSCSKVNAVAFGRVVDFYRQINHVKPNAIISLKPVVRRQHNFSEELRGSKNGQYEEEYLLVTLNKPVDMSRLSELKIGVLDILGRKPMTQFMNNLFKQKLKITRVVKTEDFLPLLTFRLADAIFVSKSTFKKLQGKTKQHLVATNTGINIGLAVLGTHMPADKDVAECIKGLDTRTNNLLGIDNWEKAR